MDQVLDPVTQHHLRQAAVDDPAGQGLDAGRQIRRESDGRAQKLIAELLPE